MYNGITIADFVQQVLYSVYKVRLDVTEGVEGAFHSKSDKFKEIVMEANLAIPELQRQQDWNWLREKWEMGHAHKGIQEFELPEHAYRVCTGYGDAVRLHLPHHNGVIQIPFTSPRQGNRFQRRMYSPSNGEYNTVNMENQAFMVGKDLCFKRPFSGPELGGLLETDIIRELPLLHICDDDCPDDCPKAYKEKVLTDLPDPYWLITRVAAKRAEGDPSAAERVQSLTDEAKQILSAYREDDSAHTIPDYWDTEPLGFVEVY